MYAGTKLAESLRCYAAWGGSDPVKPPSLLMRLIRMGGRLGALCDAASHPADYAKPASPRASGAEESAPGQARWPAAAPRGAGDGHVAHLHAGGRAAEHQAAAAHVPASDEL